MRQFQNSVLERKRGFTEPFETPPFECAWASEAILFLRVEGVGGVDPSIEAMVQISSDGVNWLDEGTAFPIIRLPGEHFVRVSHFGSWLRLRCEIKGDSPSFDLLINLVLKE